MVNEICMWLAEYGLDLQKAKMSLCMIADKYEVFERSTEIAEVQQDRNDSLIRKFLLTKAVEGKTKQTLKYYEVELPKALDRIGKTTDDITADDIRRLMALRLKRDKVSETTVENERRVLSSYLTWVSAEGYIRTNPMTRVEK